MLTRVGCQRVFYELLAKLKHQAGREGQKIEMLTQLTERSGCQSIGVHSVTLRSYFRLEQTKLSADFPATYGVIVAQFEPSLPH